MESIKKLLDYLKEYDVETVMNWSSRKPHENLGKLIEDVELSLKNSECRYILVDVDSVQGVNFIKSFGSRQEALDHIQNLENKRRLSAEAYQKYREEFVTKLLETVLVPEKYEERQKFCEKYGISRHTPPDMVYNHLVRFGKFWGNPDYKEPRIEYLGSLEIVEVS
jgi:hypothetical protein